MHSSSSLSVNEVLLIFGALNVFVLLSVLKAAYPPLKRKAHVKGHGLQRTKERSRATSGELREETEE